MFDFAWSEFGVIAVAALIFIGPKDLPVALKAVTGAIKKARRMAAEFQTHVDDFVREADLHEVREHLSDLRGMNIGRAIEKFVDEDGSMRRSFDDPLASTALATEPAIADEIAVVERPTLGEAAEPGPLPGVEPEPVAAIATAVQAAPSLRAPAFIPPGFAITAGAADIPPETPPPAFIPPSVARAERPARSA